jgi:hypothetical protein
MEYILEMEEEYENIYVLYEINNEADNIIWYYNDMPSHIGWIGRGSTVPFEKDESGNWSKRETLYPREEKFYYDINFKEDSINYLKKYFEDLLEKKTINRFILSKTSKPPDL